MGLQEGQVVEADTAIVAELQKGLGWLACNPCMAETGAEELQVHCLPKPGASVE